jgi:hypothetical protein
MVRIMVRIRQFIQKRICPKLTLATPGDQITSEDMKLATCTLIRIVQAEAFPEELRFLRSGQKVKNKVLLILSPFLDNFGVMRVGGRLKNASLSFEMKHQALLPPFHPFTTALIRAYHLENAHAGPNLTLSTLLREFWIVNGKNAVRRVTRSCIPCYRAAPRPSCQRMGDLPSYRVQHDHRHS